MSGRERPRADPDDWFAVNGSPSSLNWGAPNRPEQPTGTPKKVDAEDDWLRRAPSVAATVGAAQSRWKRAAIGTAIAAIIALAGLALADALSGGASHPSTNPSTSSATTTTRSPSTTQSIAPKQPRAIAPTSTLKPGDHGQQVTLLQRSLKRLGYSVRAVDGIYGPSTQAALMRFQKRSSLVPDGIFGSKTLHALTQALAQLG